MAARTHMHIYIRMSKDVEGAVLSVIMVGISSVRIQLLDCIGHEKRACVFFFTQFIYCMYV